jgi:hypothetical protein
MLNFSNLSLILSKQKLVLNNVEIAVPTAESIDVRIAEPIRVPYSILIDTIIEPLHSQPSVIISEKNIMIDYLNFCSIFVTIVMNYVLVYSKVIL